MEYLLYGKPGSGKTTATIKKTVEDSSINYTLLPEHLRGGVKRWVEDGIRPGSFLRAVISNKLKESFELADKITWGSLQDILYFFYSEAPSMCWGSEEKMRLWTGTSSKK